MDGSRAYVVKNGMKLKKMEYRLRHLKIKSQAFDVEYSDMYSKDFSQSEEMFMLLYLAAQESVL